MFVEPHRSILDVMDLEPHIFEVENSENVFIIELMPDGDYKLRYKWDGKDSWVKVKQKSLH
jgi:hypothetical protein